MTEGRQALIYFIVNIVAMIFGYKGRRYSSRWSYRFLIASALVASLLTTMVFNGVINQWVEVKEGKTLPRDPLSLVNPFAKTTRASIAACQTIDPLPSAYDAVEYPLYHNKAFAYVMSQLSPPLQARWGEDCPLGLPGLALIQSTNANETATGYATISTEAPKCRAANGWYVRSINVEYPDKEYGTHVASLSLNAVLFFSSIMTVFVTLSLSEASQDQRHLAKRKISPEALQLLMDGNFELKVTKR